VHQYITMLYRRFGVHSRAELMSYASKRGELLALVEGSAQA
jgi:DNA-binding CsgD family transcriptional regulator